jgi:membrane protease YdiL (CAAX protease family)
MTGEIENESGTYLARQTTYPPVKFAAAALLILFGLYQIIGGGVTLLLVGGVITEENVTAARLATMFSQIIFLLIPTLYLAKRQHGRLSDVFQWRVPSFLESLLAFAGMVVLMQLSESYLYVQNMIPVPEQLAAYIETFKKAIEEAFKVLLVARTVPELLFVLSVAALTPAICEELMFRGLIQKNFSLGYGSRKGFILSGVIFGLYHLNPFWLVPLVSLGIYFSFLQYRSKTLLLPIAAHLINNAAASVGVFLYGPSNDATPTMFQGAETAPSAMMVLGTAALSAVIFFLILQQYLKVTEKVQNADRGDDYAA